MISSSVERAGMLADQQITPPQDLSPTSHHVKRREGLTPLQDSPPLLSRSEAGTDGGGARRFQTVYPSFERTAAELALIKTSKERLEEIMSSPMRFTDPSALAELEEYAAVTQMQYPETYSLDASLFVLQQYVIHPGRCQKRVVYSILVRALAQISHQSDFDMCLYQIPLPLQEGEPKIAALIEAEGYLQTCDFISFWTNVKASPELSNAGSIRSNDEPGLLEVPGFRDAIRRYMASVLALAYQSLSVNDALQLFDFGNNKQMLQRFCQEQGWSCDIDNGVIRLAKRANSPSLVTEPSQSKNTLAGLLRSVFAP